MTKEITVHDAVIRVLFAITLMLSSMPSFSNTSVFAQDNENKNITHTEKSQSLNETIENSGSNHADGDFQISDHANAITFRDVDDAVAHSEDIQWLAQEGISTGWVNVLGGRDFRPFENIARADMAAFLYRWVTGESDETKYDASAETKAKFRDVAKDVAHAQAIWWMYDNGVTTGFDDGTFRPYSSITRCDTAAFLRRICDPLSDYEVEWDKNPFSDVITSTSHAEDVLWMGVKGISEGWGMLGGTKQFRPMDNIARADMAAFLHRADSLKWGSSSKDIDFSKVNFEKSGHVYSGVQIRPSVTIEGLQEGTDFSVDYGENVNAGEGTLTVKGCGGWSGEKAFVFTIDKRQVSVKWGATSLQFKEGVSLAPSVDLENVVDGDDVSATVSGGQVDVGKNYVATVEALVGDDASNYELPTPKPQVNFEIIEKTDETKINVGDYIKLGTYGGQDIVWRCVAMDDNGPLLLSDKVLDTLPYDAKTSNNATTASHSRNGKRATYGSNHWRDSNMRSWLNSDASAGDVNWLCGNAPSAEYVSSNAYDEKAGFLSGFTKSQKAAIKTIQHRSIVSHPEYYSGYIDGVGDDLPENYDIGTVAEGYDGAYAENIADKMFLLDVKQLSEVHEKFGDYYIAQDRNGTKWPYWLMTPVTTCNHDVRYVETNGTVYRNAPYQGYLGVRPAFYLDVDYYVSTSGDGTSSNPYVGDAQGKPDDTTEISGATRDAGEVNWDVDTDDSLQLTLGTNYSSDGTYANPVVPVFTIQKPRSDTDNMVILICADGYRKNEMQQFLSDVRRIWQGTCEKEPYKSMKDHVNVYALCTASESYFGSGNTFFDVVGTYQSAAISNSNGPWKNHILERCIGPNFIEKFHDAHIKNTTDPNNIDIWGDEYADFHYVYDNITQFVVLGNSGTYFGGSHKDMSRGINYVVAPAKYAGATYVMTHELGHGLFSLGDEYLTSTTAVGPEADPTWLNASYTSNPSLVKWKDMLGFRNTYSCPHNDTSKIYNSSHMCIMEDNTNNEFCDVCKLQAFKRESQLVNGISTIYVAEPEVKEVTGTYAQASDFEDATYSGYSKYVADRNNRLLSGSSKGRFNTSMNGKTVELRTIVQNLSDETARSVKLKMWVKHSDGSVAVDSDGHDLASEETFSVPLWNEKSKFFPKGYLNYEGTDFTSGLKNCSLSWKIPENAQLQEGDTITFVVTDASTGEVLASDVF